MTLFKESLICLLILLFTIPLCSNGQSVMSVLKNNSEVSSFVSAIEKTQLNETFSNSGTYTIFAPTNEAFDKAVTSRQSSDSRLRSFLLNHIMTGWATEKNLKIMSSSTSLGGIQLNFTGSNPMQVNNSEITTPNIRASNGVIHIIDGVLE